MALREKSENALPGRDQNAATTVQRTKGDPTHNDETGQVLQAAWNGYSAAGKAYFVSTLAILAFTLAIPDTLSYKLGIRTNKGRFKLKQVVTSPKVFQGEYQMPFRSSNCIVIKGKDGKLFIRSPPEPLPEVVAQITEHGEPGALLVSIAHDTYADKWKELFPQALVIGMRGDEERLSNRVTIDLALEDVGDLLKNYHISQFVPLSGSLRYEECILLIQLENDGCIASVGCGFIHSSTSWWNPSHWLAIINGFSGLRLLRPFGIFFVKDHLALRKAWAELAKTPGLQGLLFLHGEPLISPDLRQHMERAYLGPAFAQLSTHT